MEWRKSTRCGESSVCVEVGGAWRTSTRSLNNGNCVHLRDSADPEGPILTFSPPAWHEFIDAIKHDTLSQP